MVKYVHGLFMNRRVLASIAFVGLSVVTVRADLRYSMRVEVRETAQTVTLPDDPIGDFLKKLQQGFLETVAPGGSLEMTFAATDKATRVEYNRAIPGLPKGNALLTMSDGTSVVLDKVERTYRKRSRTQAAVAKPSALAPQVTSRRTGEFSTVSGFRAERVTFTVQFDLPAEMRRTLPPGLTALTIDGELWITDEVEVPATAIAITARSQRALGLESVVQKGFVVRQTLRGTLLGNREVTSLVSEIDSRPVPPELLRVPDDYRELQAPAGGTSK